MTDLAAIVHELRNRKSDPPAGKVTGGEVYEWCPFHPDGTGKPPHSPSLRLNREKEAWFCDPCNEGGSLKSLAERLGLDGQRDDGILAVYDYLDATGKLWGQVCRKPGKEFPVRRPDGRGGWIWDWKGTTRTLYRLPELLAADPDEWVFVVEGEKDVDRLRSLGLVATTNPGGAGKWRDEYSDTLKGRKVAIIPDHDTTGKDHAEKVARSLAGKAAGVRIVELLAENIGDDVDDWLDRGGSAEGLLSKVEAAERFRQTVAPPGIESAGMNFAPLRAEDFIDEAEEEGDEFLLGDYIPAGSLTLLVSHPKVGKSRFARQLCRAMETGGEICGKEVVRGNALYLALEEKPDDVRKHLRLLGCKETLVLARPFRLTEENVVRLTQWVREHDLKLIVADTLNRFWTVESGSDRRQADTSLAPLLDIAHHMGCTVLVLHHLRKSPGEEGTDIAESNDILAIADQTVYLKRDKRHKNRRLLQAPGLGRYPPQPDLALEFDEDGVYVGLGEAEAVQAAEDEAAILAVLDDWATAKEVSELTEITERQCRRRLEELSGKGSAGKMGRGVKNDPYRYKKFIPADLNPKVGGSAGMNGGADDGQRVEPAGLTTGQQFHALAMWEKRGRPDRLTLGEGRSITDPEKFLATASEGDLAAFIRALEEMK